MISSEVRTLAVTLLTFLLNVGRGSESLAQTQISSSNVKRVFASMGDPGWDEFDVPEFLAAAFGRRVGAALDSILSEPATPENYYYQLGALTAAGFARTGVPVDRILAFATGQKGSNIGGVLRHRAVMALQSRADPGLVQFWLNVSQERGVSFRELAAGGLACALGPGALVHLEAMQQDPSPEVRNVASFYMREFTTKGAGAHSCAGGRSTRAEAQQFPRELRTSLRQKGARILEELH